MVANGANAIPSWVSIDAANSKLVMTTPKLSSETNYTFGISSYVSVDSKSYLRYVYLQVVVPAAQTASSKSVATPWVILSILALAFILESIVSVLNQSVSASFWLIIGQYQLLTILPILGTFMPNDVTQF